MDSVALCTLLAQSLLARGWSMTTAESCTGGLIAASCTDLPGSSAWFERGFVTYSNASKTELLDVPAALIDAHGAVSEPVARAMAAGALARSSAQVSVAVTGIAGPSGGSPDKPVGLVWFAWSVDHAVESESRVFVGDRARIRALTTAHALQGLLARITKAAAAS